MGPTPTPAVTAPGGARDRSPPAVATGLSEEGERAAASLPVVVVLAGINGAGKSTISRTVLPGALRIPVFVNADTIARGLNAFDVESEAVKAGRIMLDHLRELATHRRSFAFETTLSARTYALWLDVLRQMRYVVHLFYYWLRSPELAIGRVKTRVQAGGHHIPDETIRCRFDKSVTNFLELYRPVVNTWQVYDNSGDRPRLVGLSTGPPDTVLDPETWGLMTSPAALPPRSELIDHAAVDVAHEQAAREARLEHARLGRFVCEWREGEVVSLAPEEIFARYGLDENGKPLAR